MRSILTTTCLCALPLVLAVAAAKGADAAELLIGAATTSITPDKPVPLSGQFHTRIARSVDNPVTATAVALEARQGDDALDQAILVSCDLVAIRKGVQDRFRKVLKDKLPGFDVRKAFLSATHTHTAPTLRESWYPEPPEGVIRPAEFVELLLGRLQEAATEAWGSREPAAISWALSHAAVGFNRRVVYADGTAKMYGTSDDDGFVSV